MPSSAIIRRIPADSAGMRTIVPIISLYQGFLHCYRTSGIQRTVVIDGSTPVPLGRTPAPYPTGSGKYVYQCVLATWSPVLPFPIVSAVSTMNR